MADTCWITRTCKCVNHVASVLLQIISDASAKESVYYTLTGPGLDMYPVGVFSFDGSTGQLRLMKSVDREEFPTFEVSVNYIRATVADQAIVFYEGSVDKTPSRQCKVPQ